ncbi:hypothetical protein MKY59_03430 [Paenibacillus sp. FSL W8-0426]|uniref:hypothetical protein n=1 Tax=Paenibacillus sp. FSL W8-0426 TaxID=2921714 RepID=UPI0030DC390F
MMTIACFHAHYSNIALIEEALSAYDVELVHYVDPGLDRIKSDADFTENTVRDKVARTMEWIARCHADAILVTCTLFTAVLDQETLPASIPVIGIDDPLLSMMQRQPKPYLLAFTNPSTVQGTMDRFLRHLQPEEEHQASNHALQAKSVLLPGTFELIMRGDREGYAAAVQAGLMRHAERYSGWTPIAAQLSMAPAAARVTMASGITVHSPLSVLAPYLQRELNMQLKSGL